MTRSSPSTLALAWALSAMTLIAPPPAQAADKYWNGGTNDWNLPGCWTPNGVPGAGDDVHLDWYGLPGTFQTVYYQNPSHPGPPPHLNSLSIDAPNGGESHLWQGANGYDHDLSAGSEYIGHGAGGTGVFQQTAGTNTVGDLYLGFAAGSNGRYELSKDPGYAGTGNLAATNEYVGFSGNGTFNHSAGTNTATALTIAANPGSAGAYNLSGGALSVNSMTLNAGGTFDYSGGTLAYGTINNLGGTINNSKTLIAGGQADIHNYGTLNNNSGGVLDIPYLNWMTDYGTLNNNAGATLSNEYLYETHGTLTNNGGGTISNSYVFGNEGTFTNAGRFFSTYIFDNNLGSTMTNTGEIYTTEEFWNGQGCTLTNYGWLENMVYLEHGTWFVGEMRNLGTLSNFGTLVSQGTLTNFDMGTLTNSGALITDGTLENNGTLTNTFGASLDNEGTLINCRDYHNWYVPAIVTNYGSIDGRGTYRQFDYGETWNYGTMRQGTLEIGSGTLLTNGADATLTAGDPYFGGSASNAGTINNCGTLTFGDWTRADNFGTISSSGSMAIGDDAFFANYGTLGTSGTLALGENCRLANYGVLANSGTLNVPGGSDVENHGTVLNTGTMDCDHMRSYGGTIDNSGIFNSRVLESLGAVTNSGTLSNSDAMALSRFDGGINNSGTMNNVGTVEVRGVATNTGTLNNAGLWNSIGPLDNSGTVNNHSGGTLQNLGDLSNSGILNNELGATLFDATEWGYPATLTNSGTLANAGAIVGSGHYVQTGGLTSNTGSMSQGSIDVQGGSFVADGTITVSDRFSNSGVLSGEGTIHGTVENDGMVAPGSSLGMLSIEGNYGQSTTGTLLIELGGLAQYDWLNVSGTADLYGHLDVDLFGGFVPVAGNEFDFLTATGGVFGTFQEYDLPYGLSHWDIGYGVDRVTLTYRDGVPAVPEPSSVALMVVGLAGIVAFRRKLFR